MRIIAGELKGAGCVMPTWPGLRRRRTAREALFNVLAAHVADAQVLDHAQAPAIGIERSVAAPRT
jgi:16S rRNA G966 N2-methylase RsmD